MVETALNFSQTRKNGMNMWQRVVVGMVAVEVGVVIVFAKAAVVVTS